jgi:hypothetical protein
MALGFSDSFRRAPDSHARRFGSRFSDPFRGALDVRAQGQEDRADVTMADVRTSRGDARRGLGGSIVALAALALALHAPLLRGEALACWTLIGAGAPWHDRSGPFPNAVADCDPVLLELPEALHVQQSGGARWSPLLGLGEPNGTASWPGLDHPGAWLAYRLLPPWLATGALSFLHVLAGGVCALLYLRWRGHGPRAALVAAAAYELSPLFCVWLARPWITAVMPFAALTLWAAEALARRPGPRPAVALALSTGGAVLCGFPQLALLVAGLAAPLAFASARTGRLRAAGLALAAVVLGLALAAPRLAPLSALADASSRAPIPWAEWFDRTIRLEPTDLARLVVPDAAGHPARGALPPQRSLYDNMQETRLYLGLPALVLLLAGAGRARTRPHLQGALIALALAFPTALAFPLWALVPGFKGTAPTRVLWLIHVLALPMVAAGAGALLRGERRVLRAAWVVGGVTLLACVLLARSDPARLGALGRGPHPGPTPPGVHQTPRGEAWLLAPTLGPVLLAAGVLAITGLTSDRRRARVAAAALLALLTAELLREARVYTTSSPHDAYYPETPATRAAVAIAGRDRALVHAPLMPNVLAPFGVRTLGSYGSLHSARLVALLDALGSGSRVRQFLDPSRVPAPWRDALSVRAVLTPPGQVPLHPDGLTLAHDGDDARVWTSATALPRARLHGAGSIVEVRDRDAALTLVASPSFDPRRHVVVERAGGARPPAKDAPAPLPLELVTDEAERVVVRVDAPDGGLLVLADAYAPGWTCTDEAGRPLELLPADVALRGVPLAPGFSGDVVFSYELPRRQLGLLIGVVAALVIALALRSSLARPVE